ncbi:hypothetical protein JTE90_021033 [Oedothorax gibbosus]|uniref:Endothelin-converting enzyme 1 n=1 Tax=Oedothorax gibbosus TaxID=931172 RepID=A0AAV6U747_9ARAC|nr:hypothetical protein JTE90_021033 [Oedothorax gibbosus]
MESSERTRLQHNGNEEAGCMLHTKLEGRLIIALFIITIVTLGLCIGFIATSKSKVRNESNVCFSPDCISTAADLLSSMDFEKQPCKDFYSFVCGNWVKNNYLVGEITTQFTKINNIISEKIKDILDSSNTNESDHATKTKQFYDACMDMKTRNKNGMKVLVDDLKSFGGWPLIDPEWKAGDFNWSDVLIELHQRGYPTNMFFDISVSVDIKNTSTTVILIDQPKFVLHDRRYYLLSNDTSVRRVKKFILEAASILNPNLDRETAAEELEQSFAIEKKLAELSSKKVTLREPDGIYNIKTLQEIEKFTPMIPWRSLFEAFLPPDTILHDEQRIMITNPSYLKALNKILVGLKEKKKKRDLANYMLYTAVLFAAEHLQDDLYFLYESKLHRSQAITLWKVCYRTTVQFFHLSLTASYARKYIDANGKAMVEKMFQDIKSSLLDNIKKSQWLDKETREKAILKVEKSRSAIAFPDEILDDEKLNHFYSSVKVGENHFTNVKSVFSFKQKERMKELNTLHSRFSWSAMDNFLTANAYYEPSENAIIIPIGILQGIFFSPERPNYLNYGSLGTIVGHEYTHAFDNSGGLYDEDGNFKVWWTNQSWKSFQEREQCYIDQYNKYYEDQVESYVNGNLTLGENIADNGGVAAVYEVGLFCLSHEFK